MKKSTKKGLTFIFVGLGLFVFGGFLLPMIFGVSIYFVLKSSENMERFLVPGQTEVRVEEAGRYYLWNDHETILDGRKYSHAAHIPDGVEIQVEDDAGQNLKFHTNSSISMGGSGQKKSIGYVELEEPGPVRIVVSGEMDKRVFSFGPSSFSTLIGMMVISFALTGVMLLSAIICFVIGIIKMVKASREPQADGV